MAAECEVCKNNKPFEMPEELISAAANGDLVLFCGAGISTEGKGVLPWSFYNTIQEELGETDNSISFSRLMQMYCEKPNGRKNMLKKIRERFQYIDSFPELKRSATEFHRELSEIYVINTIVTTNWDTYFEDYCGAIPITIPEDYAFWDDSSRYVLKIHGSLNNLSSIIATEKDYEKCAGSLKNGIIGATLKTILATKTVVFIGFSFGDEDFTQIINYLREEMGELYPHVYIVTLDETLKERLNYERSTAIVTSGAYYLHQLKHELINRSIVFLPASESFVISILDKMVEIHKTVSEIDREQFPSVIYTLAYQDGVIHSFERYLNTHYSGEYNDFGHLRLLIGNYDKLVLMSRNASNYWNQAYYEGYANGLTLLCLGDENIDIAVHFPFLYLPNAKEALVDIDVYMSELARVSNNHSKFHRAAKTIVQNKSGEGLIMHHPPY